MGKTLQSLRSLPFRICLCETTPRRQGEAGSLIVVRRIVYGPGVLNHRARAAGVPSRSLPQNYARAAAGLAGSPTMIYSPPALSRFSLAGTACTAAATDRTLDS